MKDILHNTIDQLFATKEMIYDAVIPPKTRDHLMNAEKEMLLAYKSIIEEKITRIEQSQSSDKKKQKLYSISIED